MLDGIIGSPAPLSARAQTSLSVLSTAYTSARARAMRLCNERKARQGTAELLALPGVLDRVVHGRSCAAQAACGHERAAPAQGLVRVLEPLGDFSEHLFARDLHRLEVDRHRGRALQAHLVLFATARDARSTSIDQHQRVSGTGSAEARAAREHREHAAESAVGHVALRAVEPAACRRPRSAWCAPPRCPSPPRAPWPRRRRCACPARRPAR